MGTQIWVITAEVVGAPTGGSARGASQMPDVTGYEVSARDGTVGKIEEVVRGHDGRTCLVVDTGFWIFGKKRMVPAGVIDTIDPKNERVNNVRVTKDDIKHAPDYDAPRRDDDDVRRAHEEHYGRYVGKS
jgi:hypothetical protein